MGCKTKHTVRGEVWRVVAWVLLASLLLLTMGCSDVTPVAAFDVASTDPASAAAPTLLQPPVSNLITVTEEEKLFHPNEAAEDEFGNAVALSEDGQTAIVGASGDGEKGVGSGAAYLFVRDLVTMQWTQQQKLTPSDGRAYDGFGASVALSGDTAIVGAPNDRSTNSGSVYTFVRDPLTNVWTEQQKLKLGIGSSFDRFGSSVGLSGDTAIIGNVYRLPNGFFFGFAYIFVRDPTTMLWMELQRLIPSTGPLADRFGASVAISGTTAIVGAPFNDDNGIDSGSAYTFVRDPMTSLWTEQQKLTPSDGAVGDFFGYSVSISGNTAIVGGPYDDDNGFNSGSAYLFVRDPMTSVWTEQQKLTASDGAANDLLGGSVSLSGDTAIVSAVGADDNGLNSGSAYIFVRDPMTSVWTEQSKLKAIDGAADDRFGGSVALSGTTAIVGVPGHDHWSAHAGTAYIFELAGNGWPQRAELWGTDGTANDRFGSAIAVSANTALVGIPDSNGENGQHQGSVGVFVRNAEVGTWTKQAMLLAADAQAEDAFGASVAIGGDTAIVGAPYDDDKGGFSGSAYIFTRDPMTLTWIQQQKLTANDGEMNDILGCSVALLGDTAIVGAYGDDTARGSAYVFERDPVTMMWGAPKKLQATDGGEYDRFGVSVALSGATAIVGAYGDHYKGSDSESAYIFVRDPVTMKWTQQQRLQATDGATDRDFGFSVALSGDTAIVGAYADDSLRGSAYIFERNPVTMTWVERQKLQAPDGASGDSFGRSVALSGTTAIVGSPWDDDKGPDSGSAYVFIRKTSGVWVQQKKLVAGDGTERDLFGSAVALSDDGSFGLIGAPFDDHDSIDDGSVYAYALRRSIGTVCAVGAGCESGSCVDGVCCDNPCNEPCQACSVAMRGGGVDGFCGPAKIGTDPGDRCVTEDVSTCGQTGVCAANGTCSIYQYGEVCAPAQCVDENKARGSICNGSGTCTPDPLLVDCGSYACDTANGTCKTNCTSSDDCSASAHCENGVCEPDRFLGTGCTTNTQCASGFCVDGVCCDSPCEGTCQACSAAGYCGNVAKDTPDDACAKDPTNPCGYTGTCTEFGACAVPAYGTNCGSSICNGFLKIDAQICNGTGQCVPDLSKQVQCFPYQCANVDINGNPSAECKTSCIQDANGGSSDCVGGYVCRDARCVPETKTCASVNDCPLGQVCNPETKQCQVRPEAPPTDTGCDCQLPARSSERNAWPLVSVALLAIALRRTQRRYAA